MGGINRRSFLSALFVAPLIPLAGKSSASPYPALADILRQNSMDAGCVAEYWKPLSDRFVAKCTSIANSQRSVSELARAAQESLDATAVPSRARQTIQQSNSSALGTPPFCLHPPVRARREG